jgi:hypothetical protein
MTQAEVKAAIDKAFDEQMGKIFGILIQNLIIKDPTAAEHFQNGLRLALSAHQFATAAAEDLVKP